MNTVTDASAEEPIFKNDEFAILSPSENMSKKALLRQVGIFYLKDIVDHLGIDSAKIKHEYQKLQKQKIDPWEAMGARKIWSHWLIRMSTFAPYFQQHLEPRIQRIEGPIGANRVLNLEGLFYLTDVCRYLPFSASQLRYQAKTNPNSRQQWGTWKDEELRAYIVDMKLFSQWIKALWKGDFKSET